MLAGTRGFGLVGVVDYFLDNVLLGRRVGNEGRAAAGEGLRKPGSSRRSVQ